jgi:hypothetical protein
MSKPEMPERLWIFDEIKNGKTTAYITPARYVGSGHPTEGYTEYVRADLLQRVPDERLAEIKKRYSDTADESATYRVDVNDLAWLINEVELRRPAASGRCVRCGRVRETTPDIVPQVCEVDTPEIFCVFPATGATSEHEAQRSNHFSNAAVDKGTFPDHISSDGTAYYSDGTVLRPAPTAAPSVEGSSEHYFVPSAASLCLRCGLSVLAHPATPKHNMQGTTSDAAGEAHALADVCGILGNHPLRDEYEAELAKPENEGLPPSAPVAAQTWCDHCSADLNDTQHVLCERCYGAYAGPKWFDPAFIPEPIILSARDFQRFLAALESEDEEPNEKLKALFKVEENQVGTAPAGVDIEAAAERIADIFGSTRLPNSREEVIHRVTSVLRNVILT